jgi:NitT/TauT family transport system permease protein
MLTSSSLPWRRRWASAGLSTAWLLRLLSIALFLGLWELAGRIPISLAFPTCGETLRALGQMALDGRLARAYGYTLEPLAIGVAISAVFGVAAGVLMGLSRPFEWIGAPLFIVLQAAPMAALIPLVTFIYGIGLAAKVVAVVILAAPIIVLNAYKAVRNASPSLIAMSRSFLASRRGTIFRVIIPDASPLIFAGLRLGVAAGFIGVILAELLITPTGVGDLITYHRSVAEYPEMYAAIFSIVVFAAISVGTLERLEATLFRPDKRGATVRRLTRHAQSPE